MQEVQSGNKMTRELRANKKRIRTNIRTNYLVIRSELVSYGDNEGKIYQRSCESYESRVWL